MKVKQTILLWSLNLRSTSLCSHIKNWHNWFSIYNFTHAIHGFDVISPTHPGVVNTLPVGTINELVWHQQQIILQNHSLWHECCVCIKKLKTGYWLQSLVSKSFLWVWLFVNFIVYTIFVCNSAFSFMSVS